jgi:16S rRNA (cytidine1402-2'-O)-methyltransferase
MPVAGEGVLYICPTPIGNLEDITLRVLRVLGEVDLIAAEDTRRTLKLLNHYSIKTPMTSYYEHNKREKGEYILQQLAEGKSVALVSDAGTPGISDPGEELVKMVLDRGGKVVSLPGATAIITALVASGLPTKQFFFQGFLPKDSKQRKSVLEGLKYQQGTLIIYASPHNLTDVLEDCLEILGNRGAVIGRELTKKYEEFIRGSVAEVLEKVRGRKIRGEFVLLLEGGTGERKEERRPWEGLSIREHILANMEKGLSKKEAVALTARERNIPKRHVYSESIDL